MFELHKAVLVCQLGCTLNSVSYKLYYLFQGLKYLLIIQPLECIVQSLIMRVYKMI